MGPHFGQQGPQNFGSMSHHFNGQGMTGKRNITFDLLRDKRSRKVNSKFLLLNPNTHASLCSYDYLGSTVMGNLINLYIVVFKLLRGL